MSANNGSNASNASENTVAHLEVIVDDLGDDDIENRPKQANGEPFSDKQMAALVLDQIPDHTLANLDCIVTGRQAWLTRGLQKLSDDGTAFVPSPSDEEGQGIDMFFYKTKNVLEDNEDMEFKEAQNAARHWVRKNIYVEDFDKFYTATADIAITVDLGASRGCDITNDDEDPDNMVEHAYQEGLPVTYIKAPDIVDKDVYFQDNEAEEQAEEDADQGAPTVDNGGDLADHIPARQ